MIDILNIDGLKAIPVEDISKDIMKSSNDIRIAILTKNRKFLFLKWLLSKWFKFCRRLCLCDVFWLAKKSWSGWLTDWMNEWQQARQTASQLASQPSTYPPVIQPAIQLIDPSIQPASQLARKSVSQNFSCRFLIWWSLIANLMWMW